jgi:ABC-type antimicrobial peptide transport system permease subunit
MRAGTLVLRSLTWFWRTNLPVVVGAAVAVSVLAGALLVGDSVRSSLRRLALERLGATDVMVTAPTFVREALADDLRRASDAIQSAVPLVALDAVVTHVPSGRRAGSAQVFAVDDRFWRFHGVPGITGPAGRDAFASPALAAELSAAVGDPLVVRVQRPSAIPSGVLQGRRDDVARGLRLTVRAVLPPDRLGEFSLVLSQAPIRALFVPLARVQRDLEQPGSANAILVAGGAETGDGFASTVTRALGTAAQADDVGLKVIIGDGTPDGDGGNHAAPLIVESASGLLSGQLRNAVERGARHLGYATLPVLTYLANTIRVDTRELPYSVITAIDLEAYERLTRSRTVDDGLVTGPATPPGSPRPPAADSPPVIWLNAWAAGQLDARAGGQVSIEYFLWSDDRGLETRRAAFTLAGIVPMEGAGRDRTLTPEYPGMTDAPRIGDWDPPFPVDLRRIRPADEQYWERFRAAPKAFVTLETGQRLWSSPFGDITSVRVYPPARVTAATARDALLEAVRSAWAPTAAGLSVHAVRARALDASRGSTDFGEYFLYFSFFLAVSGLLLMGLFFRLGIEQRTREVGLLRSIGFSVGKLRRQLLAEGTVLAGLGSLVGTVGAVGFSSLILLALRTWWVGAVGTRALALDVTPLALGTGGVAGVLMAVATIWWTLRGLAIRTPRALMSDGPVNTASASSAERTGHGFMAHLRYARSPGWLLAAALVLLGLGWRAVISDTTAFFSAGLLVLAAALTAFGRWVRHPAAAAIHEPGTWGLVRLGARQTAWRPGRSVLSVALIASATFMIVAVGAFRRDAAGSGTGPGTGGFALYAEALAPLMYDLTSPGGRAELGFSAEDEAAAARLRIARFRLRPGDDGSCLNLYRAASPRIIAPTDAFRREARFAFGRSLAASDAERQNPWLLLDRTFADGALPVIGDANSLAYALHRSVGDDLVISGPGGTPVTLRVVAALADSVFKSELLVSERDFVRAFTRDEGARFFLIDAPADRRAAVAALLEDRLADYGFDVQSTAERLSAYHRVENTYLTTFQTLGGLGLVLGTFGLGAVLLRNVLERRRELALLGAVGYRARHLATMILAESVLLLSAGLLAGLLAALLAIAPALWARGGPFPIASTIVLLAGVFAAGLLSTVAATRAAASGRLLQALRSE